MSTKRVQEVAKEYGAQLLADVYAPKPLSPDETAASFREVVADAALAHGVRRRAIRYVVRDAAEHFTLGDHGLVPKGRAVDPHDPLVPLSIHRWLQQLAVSDPMLFDTPPTVAGTN